MTANWVGPFRVDTSTASMAVATAYHTYLWPVIVNAPSGSFFVPSLQLEAFNAVIDSLLISITKLLSYAIL